MEINITLMHANGRSKCKSSAAFYSILLIQELHHGQTNIPFRDSQNSKPPVAPPGSMKLTPLEFQGFSGEFW
jgi:hypothetical protein